MLLSLTRTKASYKVFYIPELLSMVLTELLTAPKHPFQEGHSVPSPRLITTIAPEIATAFESACALMKKRPTAYHAVTAQQLFFFR